MYEAGQGVPKNEKESIKWITHAAEGGDPEAQLIFGKINSLKGYATENNRKSYFWYSISAALGNEKSIIYREAIGQRLSHSELIKIQKKSNEWLDDFYKKQKPTENIFCEKK